MKRDLDQLTRKKYDVLIVGGGIYGAALARETALSGLATAVVDKDDFCGATSANSLKIIHGGVRYLQQFDLPRLRQSVRERRILMQIAPHLVHRLPCAMPTYGHLMKSRAVMAAGLLANDLLSWDRNRGVAADKMIPMGRIGSRAEWLAMVPGLDDPRYTGVALWHDAYAYNTERLGLGFVQAAVQAGADAANYVEITGFQRRGQDITGVTAVDRMTGRGLAVTAKLTIINTGPWTKQTLGLLEGRATCPNIRLALAMNLVLRRQLIPRYAVGLTTHQEGWKKNRLFFFVPWRGRTMIGTYLRPHEGGADRMNVTEHDIESFIASLNQACPGANVEPKDIAHIHAGLLPAEDRDVAPGEEPKLINHFKIIDHAESDGINGLMTVLGVKYTTARDLAQKTLDRVGIKLGRSASTARLALQPLPGGDIADVGRLINEAVENGLTKETARRLVYNYGEQYRSVIRPGSAGALRPGEHGGDDPRWPACNAMRSIAGRLAPIGETAAIIGAEVIHAVRDEMALTLADVVLRRTDLGSAGLPDDADLRNVALLMARELGWDDVRIHKEIEEVKARRH